MTNLLIFSAIAAAAVTILMFPFFPAKVIGEDETPKRKIPFSILIGFFIIVLVGTGVFYYVTNLDYNFTSLWIMAIIATILGALLSNGIERKVKLFLSLASIIIGLYFSLAFLFNADEKYEQATMEVKEEIEIFDESKKPASVPPSYAENKMKNNRYFQANS